MPGKHILLWTDEFYESIEPHINSLGFFKTTPGWISSSFNRIQKDFDIWYITEGTGQVRVNDEWVQFRKGDIVTIKPGENYQQEKSDDNSPFSTYALHLDIFKDGKSDIKENFIYEWPRKSNLDYQPEIENLFDKLLKVYTFRKPGSSLLIKSILLNIMDILFEAVHGNTENKYPPVPKAIVATKDYIEEHFNEDWTLADMAKHSGLSYTYFSKLFNQYFKNSPIDYLINYRLKMAKVFLSKGHSVSETSIQCGFHSIHYFSRLFRKNFGISPSAFAQSCRIKFCSGF